MEYRYELTKYDDGWCAVNMIGQEGEDTSTFTRFCKTEEEAQEFMKTHNVEEEVKRRIRAWEQAIKEEDEADDGLLKPVVNGYWECRGEYNPF